MSRDAIYLEHILDAISEIESYTAVGKVRFSAEPHWQDAVIRQLEITGEATKQLSADLRDRHPEVAWRRKAGLRDVLIHDYMGVDLEVICGVTEHALPELKRNIGAILGEDNPARSAC